MRCPCVWDELGQRGCELCAAFLSQAVNKGRPHPHLLVMEGICKLEGPEARQLFGRRQQIFIVMEWCDWDLDALIAARAKAGLRVQPQEMLRMAAEVAYGMWALHEKRMLHRPAAGRNRENMVGFHAIAFCA